MNGMTKMEIERKFLLEKAPFDLSGYPHAEIEQAYISVDPVIRLRRQNEKFILTIKLGGAIAREETEFALKQSQFDHLWEKIETRPIYKTRYFIPLENDLMAELDVYHGELHDLYTVEVEFKDMTAAQSFTPPSWFGRDVSEVRAYKNSSLAVHGMPKL
jgi:CYTH domain-containing protein